MSDPDAFDPPPGVPTSLAPGLRRILAPNPSPMTWRGTNTYLLGETDVAVIDPGPDDADHLEALLAALEPGQKVSHIFVTHAHRDHSPLARPLASRTGAPVLAFGDAAAGRSDVMARLAGAGLMRGGEGVDTQFNPDRCLRDGEILEGPGWRIEALWTPGHFGNHMCFDWNGAVFSGDLVMGWASSLVSPPDGDLSDFMASCHRLRSREAAVLYPGHGAPVIQAHERIDWLIAHRKTRETAIRAQLARGAATAAQITAAIYTDTPERLIPAATRNVLTHLIDLTRQNKARAQGDLTENAIFESHGI